MKTPDATWATTAGKRYAPQGVPLVRVGPARELVADAHKVLATRRAYPGKGPDHKRILLVLEDSDLKHPGVFDQVADLAKHGRNSELIVDVTAPVN